MNFSVVLSNRIGLDANDGVSAAYELADREMISKDANVKNFISVLGVAGDHSNCVIQNRSDDRETFSHRFGRTGEVDN